MLNTGLRNSHPAVSHFDNIFVIVLVDLVLQAFNKIIALDWEIQPTFVSHVLHRIGS